MMLLEIVTVIVSPTVIVASAILAFLIHTRYKFYNICPGGYLAIIVFSVPHIWFTLVEATSNSEYLVYTKLSLVLFLTLSTLIGIIVRAKEKIDVFRGGRRKGDTNG